MKDFELAISELVDGYRKGAEPGQREGIVSSLRIQADLIAREDVWPSEQDAINQAIKDGQVAEKRPTEGEMKNAAAAAEAAKMAEARGVEDDYTPEEARDENWDAPIGDPARDRNAAMDNAGGFDQTQRDKEKAEKGNDKPKAAAKKT